MALKLFPSFEGVQPKAKARSTLGGRGVIGGGGKSDFDRKGFGKGGLRRQEGGRGFNLLETGNSTVTPVVSILRIDPD